MARSASLAWCAAALSLSGCEVVDLVESEARAPSAYVLVSFNEGDVTTATILVNVRAGIDDRGRTNRLEDSTLILQGHTLMPDSFSSPDGYWYRSAADPAQINLSGIRVQLPRVSVQAGPKVDVTIPVIRRAGPMQIRLQGSDLNLSVLPAPATVLAPQVTWALTLSANCATGAGGFARFNGRQPPPATFTLARQMLAQLAPAEFSACLSIQSIREHQQGSFTLTAQLTNTIAWQVTSQ